MSCPVGVAVVGADTDGIQDVLEVEVIDNTEDYVKQITSIFDVASLRTLIARPDFKFVYDGMHGGGSRSVWHSQIQPLAAARLTP